MRSNWALSVGRVIAEEVSRWLPTAAARASGQVFSKYFGFPCKKPFIPPTSALSQSPGAVSRGLATSWSPVQGVLPTVLDLVTEMKRLQSHRKKNLSIKLSLDAGPQLAAYCGNWSWCYECNDKEWLWNLIRLIPSCVMNIPWLLKPVPRPQAVMLQTFLPVEAKFCYFRP
jgi:hypothetical protein